MSKSSDRPSRVELGPGDVARAFFQAIEEQRWLDAASLFHPEMIEDRAEHSLDRIARMQNAPPRTVESVLEAHPSMPPDIAQSMLERDPNAKLTAGERIARSVALYHVAP